MSLTQVMPIVMGLLVGVYVVQLSLRSSETLSRNWLLPACVASGFLLWTLAAVIHEGPAGFWSLHTRSLWGTRSGSTSCSPSPSLWRSWFHGRDRSACARRPGLCLCWRQGLSACSRCVLGLSSLKPVRSLPVTSTRARRKGFRAAEIRPAISSGMLLPRLRCGGPTVSLVRASACLATRPIGDAL